MSDRRKARPSRKRSADPVTPETAMQARAADVATHDGGDDGAALTRYPGGKNGAGVWQRIINQMPPHRVYIEVFLGSGAVLRRKRPAAENLGLDIARRLEGMPVLERAAVIAAINATRSNG